MTIYDAIHDLMTARNQAQVEAHEAYRDAILSARTNGGTLSDADAALALALSRIRRDFHRVRKFAVAFADQPDTLRCLSESLAAFGLHGVAHDVLTESPVEAIGLQCGWGN